MYTRYFPLTFNVVRSADCGFCHCCR